MIQQLFFHGFIILLIGLIGGYPFSFSAHNKKERETAWRLFHFASCMGGIMLIAIAACLHVLEISEASTFWVLFFSLIANYAFVLGMFIAAVSGERGLKWEKKFLNKAVYILYSVATTFSLVFILILLYSIY
ncbi:MAG: hypothetical protein AAFY48_18560 [Bacteroidota bacterium]